jgi:hypothetical protein
MESRFGHDFSQVRVHTDERAAESAQEVNALAYTVGRHVVFGTNQYYPAAAGGGHLLAHELAHVLQQRYAQAELRPSGISVPGDPGEREADALADRVMAGSTVLSGPAHAGLGPANILQRRMLNNVITDFQPDPKAAQACIVHIHGEEQNALAAAREMRSRRCVNLVHLDTAERWISFEVSDGKNTHVCKADPNRIFTEAGRESHAITTCSRPGVKGDTSKAVHDAAKQELKDFVENDFGVQIGRCRGGGAATLDGELPIVALHNNEGLSPDAPDIKKVTEHGARLPDDPKDPSKKLPNPASGDPTHPHDFFLTTQPEEFVALRNQKRNVVLQANPLPAGGDDGSLSVALKDARYVNVEKEGRAFSQRNLGGGFKGNTMTYIEDVAMAADALNAVGAPDGPCPAPAQTAASAKEESAEPEEESAIDAGQTAQGTSATGQPETEKTTAPKPTDAPLLKRDAVPATPPKGCRVFNDQAALDGRKDEWAKQLGRMPLSEIINWIVGSPDKLPPAAVAEVETQKNCLITAMMAAAKAQGLKIPTGKILKSEQRTFEQQRAIWERKYKFTGAPFDRISPAARAKCGSLIDPTDVQWNPKKTNHRLCWGTAAPPGGTTVPHLTPEERQEEILMASAAPGVSRHHAGTDFDIGQKDADLEPEAWTGKGDFADAYRWLAPNAATWGFIQPFETQGGYGKGYMAERWHWSYYPIAQALLEFAIAHQSEIEDELRLHWTDNKGIVQEQFKFIMDHWRDYMFNVETRGRF